MAFERGIPSSVKFLLFFVCIAWIFYYTKTTERGATFEDTHMIEFENVKFSYEIRKNSVKCANKTVLLAISSSPNAINQRMAFRHAWTKRKDSPVIYRFFVGLTSNESIRHANFEESEKYNDMVITSVFESSITAVFKTYSMFTWQQNNCPTVKYILKSQDNTLISIQRLLYWIDNKFENEFKSSERKMIFCRTMEYPDTSVKYKLKSNNQSGIDYCEDRSYLISSKAVKLMLSKAPNETLKNSIFDLMFTGLLAEAVGVDRIHSPKYFTLSLTNCGCDENNKPYTITSEGQWKDNSTFFFDYAGAAQKFVNMSCKENSRNTLEFFKNCIAHTG